MGTTAFTASENVAVCDLCGGTVLDTVAQEAAICRCHACGYTFVSPRPTQEAIARSYSEAVYDGWIKDDAGRQRMWAKRVCLLGEGDSLRLLDVGAGIGTFISIARDELGWSVTGTETSADAARIARQRYGLELLVGQLEEVDLPTASFDVITLWHVLEHVPFPGRTLDRCRSLLVPGGRLVLAVPNDNEARSFLVRAKASLQGARPAPRYAPLTPHEEVHLSHFSSPVLVRALRSRGFRIKLVTVDDQYANPTPRSDRLVRAYRLIHRLTRLNFGQATVLIAASPELGGASPGLAGRQGRT